MRVLYVQGRYFEGQVLGTPSAPPIAGGDEEVMFDAVGKNIGDFVIVIHLI